MLTFREGKNGHFARGVLQIRPFLRSKIAISLEASAKFGPSCLVEGSAPDFWKMNPVRNLSLFVVVQHRKSTFFGPPFWGRQFDSFAFLTRGPLWRSKVAISLGVSFRFGPFPVENGHFTRGVCQL